MTDTLTRETFPTTTEHIADAMIVLGIIRPDTVWSHKSDVAYTVTLPNGTVHLRSDLRVLTRDSNAETLKAAYASLLGFMSACADGYRYEMTNGAGSSENASLFPRDLAEWCYVNSEEIEAALWESDPDSRYLD